MEPVDTTQITSIWTFLETIDWTDPWFGGLLVFHLTHFLVTFLTRNKQTLQAGHFLMLLLMVYFAENLNELAAKHWKEFSAQQYFDSKGMFISLVWSSPLLMNCLIIVMSWIMVSSQLMVTTGKLKLQQERRAQEQRQKENPDAEKENPDTDKENPNADMEKPDADKKTD